MRDTHAYRHGLAGEEQASKASRPLLPNLAVPQPGEDGGAGWLRPGSLLALSTPLLQLDPQRGEPAAAASHEKKNRRRRKKKKGWNFFFFSVAF